MIWIILIPVWFTVGFVGGLFFGVLNDRFGILSSKWRFPAYALSSLLAFLILFGDELVGKWQFQRLCQTIAGTSVVNANEIYGKKVILNVVVDKKPNSRQVENMMLPIRQYSYIYEDVKTEQTYFTEERYEVNGGIVTRALFFVGLGLESKAPILFSKNSCGSISNNYDLKKQYGFKIVPSRNKFINEDTNK